MSKLFISTVPQNFRNGEAPSFKEMADIIYSLPNTHYCSVEDISKHIEKIDDYFVQRFGNSPEAIVVYESLLNHSTCEIFFRLKTKVVFITEDLHLTSLSSLKNAVKCATVVMSRFNIIEDLFEEGSKKVSGFPLHCSEKFLADPIVANQERIVNYGQIFCAPPNINIDLSSSDVNQYKFRMDWHRIFTEKYEDNYTYLRTNPENLLNEIRKYSVGFACTYFPYSFSDKCRDEQGLDWASHNTPLKIPRGYFVAKFFEIPGAGLLLLADPTGIEDFLYEAGFKNGENYISIDKNNHKEVINYIFEPKNKNRINEIRFLGNKLIKDRHLIDNRINTYCSKILNLT